jgi:hypothetical protein
MVEILVGCIPYPLRWIQGAAHNQMLRLVGGEVKTGTPPLHSPGLMDVDHDVIGVKLDRDGSSFLKHG